MKKQVGFLTTFAEVTSGYSLVAVCETQIRMLLDHGYDPVVLVEKGFTSPDDKQSVWRREIIDLRDVVPFMHLEPGIHEEFDERAESVRQALEANLKDVDVCITHDIILQTFYKEHNIAMRQYAQARPDLLWLHWIHSCPTPSSTVKHPESCRYTPPPGYVVYPNNMDKPRVCDTYKLSGREWKVKVSRTGHSIDPLLIWPYDKLTKELATKADLFGGDVVVVYPIRLDRGKQPEKIVYLLAGVKALGYEPRLLVIDWQSTGAHFQRYIDELLDLAKQLGLEGCVNFTSRLDDRCSQGIPRQCVLELMDLSNVYIHPSRIETYSLTVHEAALRGNLLVLNYDLPMMWELWGEHAIYMDFGSDRVERDYRPDERTFWHGEANRLIAELMQNRAAMMKTKVRKEYSPQAMWREFEPLLYLMPVGE